MDGFSGKTTYDVGAFAGRQNPAATFPSFLGGVKLSCRGDMHANQRRLVLQSLHCAAFRHNVSRLFGLKEGKRQLSCFMHFRVGGRGETSFILLCFFVFFPFIILQVSYVGCRCFGLDCDPAAGWFHLETAVCLFVFFHEWIINLLFVNFASKNTIRKPLKSDCRRVDNTKKAKCFNLTFSDDLKNVFSA